MNEFLLAIGLTLLVALVLGEIVEQFGQPGLLGEIAAGIVLGPHVLGVVSPEGPFAMFATIGAVLLFFDVGYEQIEFGELFTAGIPAVGIALSGMAIPAVVGTSIGQAFGYDLDASLFLGLVFAVTSIAVTVRTLMHLGRVDTDYGVRIVGAAVIDDVIGLIALALLLVFVRGQSASTAGQTFGLIALFFFASGVLGWLVTRISRSLDRSVQRGADFLAVMGLLFVFAYAAEVVGMTASIGAFVVGLIVGSEERFSSMSIRQGIVGVAYGLFIPLFFAFIGSQLDVRVLADLDVFIVVVVAAGLATKLIGGYLGSRITGGRHDESIVVGVGLLPKSEVGLAIIGIGVAETILDERILTAFLVLMMVSVLITPPLLKRATARVPGG